MGVCVGLGGVGVWRMFVVWFVDFRFLTVNMFDCKLSLSNDD